MNFVSRNFLSARMHRPQDMSDSNSLGNPELEHGGVSSRGRKLTQNTNQNPTMSSQERQQDDTQSSSAKQAERGEDIHMGRSRREFHNMQISDYRYLVKVFRNLRKKLNLTEDSSMIGIEALKTNVLMWGLFMSATMKAAIHLGPNHIENLEVYRKSTTESEVISLDAGLRMDDVSALDVWGRGH